MDMQICTKERPWRHDFDVTGWRHPDLRFLNIRTDGSMSFALYECEHCRIGVLTEAKETEPESYQ